MAIDLPLVWAGLLAFAVLMYVVLDGFDLGVGMLFPLARREADHDVMMNSVAPVWDGNETWLVLGGGGLFAVFPLAYAVMMPALYMPIILMLLALVFRGVAFEYRWRTRRWKSVWNTAFFGGSLLAGLCQGITLGALVQGIEMKERAYAGGWWDWLSPFTLLTGVAVCAGYALLGATWLVMKLDGELQQAMRGYAKKAALATLVGIGLVSLFTPWQSELYMQRWFAWPTGVFTVAVPALVGLSAWALLRGLQRTDRDAIPFLAALALFVLGFIGIGISFYPYLIPPHLTIQAAAAPDTSLQFVLVGAAVLLPIILIYTAYAYWVFRGKIDPEQGYH